MVEVLCPQGHAGRVVRAGRKRYAVGDERQMWWCYPDSASTKRHRFCPSRTSKSEGTSTELFPPWGRHSSDTIVQALYTVAQGASVREAARRTSLDGPPVSPRIATQWVERYGQFLVDVILLGSPLASRVDVAYLYSVFSDSAEEATPCGLWGWGPAAGFRLERLSSASNVESILVAAMSRGELSQLTVPADSPWSSASSLRLWESFGVRVEVDRLSVLVSLRRFAGESFSSQEWALDELHRILEMGGQWQDVPFDVRSLLARPVQHWLERHASGPPLNPVDRSQTLSVARRELFTTYENVKRAYSRSEVPKVVRDLAVLYASGRFIPRAARLLIDGHLSGVR